MKKISDTPFTQKRVEITPRVKFHSEKSENQSLFTPTQKSVVLNSTLSRVKISFFHLKKSEITPERVKITLERVEITLKRVNITLERVKITLF